MSDTQRDREERQHVIEVLKSWDGYFIGYTSDEVQEALRYAIASIKTDLKYDLLYEETREQADKRTTKNDLGVREFEEIVVEYPPEDLCTYPEYKGKPYFGIKYKENEKEIVGYGTYKPEVLSQYLKNYFISTTKDYLGVDAISRQAINGYIDYILSHGMGKQKSFEFIKKFVANLPPVTLQLSSGLDKNSKKLEKDFDESDCISRQAVDRLVWECLRKETDETIAFYENFLDLPSVTPIRPKGRWIGHREHCENLGVMPSGLGAYEWCSNCDCGIDVMEWHRNHYNYCPNCGSDNREVEE